jgi:hypothetical protein
MNGQPQLADLIADKGGIVARLSPITAWDDFANPRWMIRAAIGDWAPAQPCPAHHCLSIAQWEEGAVETNRALYRREALRD